jgi:hypothetical protein
MRLRFGEEPGAAGQPAVPLLPIEILVPVSGYPSNLGDGVQVHVASPPRPVPVHSSSVSIDIRKLMPPSNIVNLLLMLNSLSGRAMGKSESTAP